MHWHIRDDGTEDVKVVRLRRTPRGISRVDVQDSARLIRVVCVLLFFCVIGAGGVEHEVARVKVAILGSSLFVEVGHELVVNASQPGVPHRQLDGHDGSDRVNPASLVLGVSDEAPLAL